MTPTYAERMTAPVPQSQPLVGRETEMVKNNADGYTFEMDDWTRLDRFLILGTDGGTYYVGEQKLTRDAAQSVVRCIKEDGSRVVNRIVDVSTGNLAPKNDPCIFALALAAKEGDETTRRFAFQQMSAVCRTGTHLFQFVEAIDTLSGWGRGARRAAAKWYTDKEPEKLALQLVKYRQRNGWTHRDVLRLSKPKGRLESTDMNMLLGYATGKMPEGPTGLIIDGYELAKKAWNPLESAQLIRKYNLPRECIQTEHLNSPHTLEALLEKMPATALLRNLGNLTKHGVIAPFSNGTDYALQLLLDSNSLKRQRVHPMAVYLALAQYASGKGFKGSGEWTPVQRIVDALNVAFFDTMQNVVPTGKKMLYALDTSGSMMPDYRYGDNVYDSPIAKGVAMLMIAARTEEKFECISVSTSVLDLRISPLARLDSAIETALSIGGGGTNLALPYEYLDAKNYDCDGVVLFTDDETWAGNQHASVALDKYRKKVSHSVRNVVASMVAHNHGLGDPKDADTLQMVGLDANLPHVVNAFMRGEF